MDLSSVCLVFSKGLVKLGLVNSDNKNFLLLIVIDCY